MYTGRVSKCTILSIPTHGHKERCIDAQLWMAVAPDILNIPGLNTPLTSTALATTSTHSSIPVDKTLPKPSQIYI